MNNNDTVLIHGGKLVGQGVDGCVHNPPVYSCNFNKYMNNKYVSKLQFYSIYYLNELNASNLIKYKYYNNYKNHFSIILHKCKLNFDQINQMSLYDKHTCSFFSDFKINNKYKSDTLFTISIYKYVVGFPLKEFFDFNKTTLFFKNDTFQYLQIAISNFFYLQISIHMINYNINLVHNDLHYYNIIVDTDNNNLPIIIDFGRSFVVNLDDHNNYYKFLSYFDKFSFKPERTWDSFEIRFIYYILKYNLFSSFYNHKDYNNIPNFLKNKKYIDNFIDIIVTYDFNYYKNISNNKFDFNKIIIMYKKFLRDFLYKFSDTKLFPSINDVIFYIYSNFVLYSIDSYSIIFNFLDFYLSNYYHLSKIDVLHNIFIKYLFVNINPIINFKFMYKTHFNFFKYIYKFFKSDKFIKNQTYLYFEQNMFQYFHNNNVNTYYFIENDIFKSIYDSKTNFVQFFDSFSFYY